MDEGLRKQWYDKTWLVIILCIFIFPVGLYALWKNKSIQKDWKIGVTVFVGIIVIVQIGVGLILIKTEAKTNNDNWVSIGNNGSIGCFVNTNMQKNDDGYYRVWVKFKLVDNVEEERNKMAKESQNEKYLKYNGNMSLYIIDVSQQQFQIISTSDYTEDGDVIFNHDDEYHRSTNWKYAAPNTLNDAVISFVTKTVNNK